MTLDRKLIRLCCLMLRQLLRRSGSQCASCTPSSECGLYELKSTNKKAVVKLKSFADGGESYLDYFEISLDVEDLMIIGGHKSISK